MNGLDLRPLTLGEILDRTFSLYRRHFLLFIGISAIPQVLVLAFSVASLLLSRVPGRIAPLHTLLTAFGILAALAFVVVYLVAYLFSQGGTIFAVSDLYLGRPTTIAASLRRVSGEFWSLFGVLLLNGLAVLGGFLLLVIPGIYIMCRLLVCVPAALIERRGPRESLSRSFDLTRDYAGRAFMVILLYFVIAFAVQMCIGIPFGVAAFMVGKNSSALLVVQILSQVAGAIGNVLVIPILLIATSVFYFDLRVRKEAFDLQFMMDPNNIAGPRSLGVPSILS